MRMQFSDIDLNLLMTFKVLNEHRHVTKAAVALRLSQPALSHKLSKLRELFKDDLFVKTPAGMMPTPLALELAPAIERVFVEIETSIFSTRQFDPKNLRRVFRIRTTDFIEHLLADKLIRALQRESPHVQISFTALQFTLPKSELERADVDLAIAGFFDEIPAGFYQQNLFKDVFKCCVRRNHPRIGKSMSLSDYANESHVLIAPGGSLTSALDDELKKQKLKRHISIGCGSYLSSGWVVSQTDAVLTAPSRLLESFEKILPIKIFDLPIKRPAANVIQVWHERQNSDAAHKWFRQLVFNAMHV